MGETEVALRHYLGMKTFGLSLFLMMLGIASVAAQTSSREPVVAVTLNDARPSQKEPGLEAASPLIGSTGGEQEPSRLATRPPTPLVSK